MSDLYVIVVGIRHLPRSEEIIITGDGTPLSEREKATRVGQPCVVGFPEYGHELGNIRDRYVESHGDTELIGNLVSFLVFDKAWQEIWDDKA